MSPSQCGKELDNRFPGCMKGRIMYVIPFSLGAINGRYSKIGIELTDSEYAVLCMRIITRVSMRVFEALGDRDFIRCVHSVGVPLSGSDENSENPSIRKDMVCWPCNPTKAFLVHRPCEREIWSFGSGFGTNSLLGRKSMGLRIASSIARDEGWLAEHMAVFCELHLFLSKLGIEGDDIAWLRIGEGGRLYAVNPEFGFFGIAPGLSKRTNSAVMTMLRKNSIFTNVAETSNGEFFWQGLEDEIKDKNVEIEDWTGSKWHIGDKSRPAHYNARYIAPASQCPLMHHKWESSKGVPIDAILFGSRRPRGVPLVYETFSWQHGVFTGACLKSEVYSDGG
ncbi:unnamed protein product, partial [Anisakis simplex]|uniref:phosphoenolpyruvate carboxykinase (GTP) n=1 Tax=Anisakis simplex TaxID=6269 RepID=A0A0M3J2S1_ANISI